MKRVLSPFSYAKGEIPPGYKCDTCPATGVKLWREYQTMADVTELVCAACACKSQGKENNVDAEGFRHGEYGRTDQIGWRIPAVPLEDDDTYWGYTSVPDEGVKWWKKLPTK